MESTPKGPGRPRGSGKADATLRLFDGVNPAFTVGYDEIERDSYLQGETSAGPVGGGGAGTFVAPPESDEALLAALWANGHDPSIPAGQRASNLDKYARVRDRMRQGDSGGDVRPELEAFLAALGGRHPADCDKGL